MDLGGSECELRYEKMGWCMKGEKGGRGDEELKEI